MDYILVYPDKLFFTMLNFCMIYFCHTPALLTIPDHLIIIPDDHLGPHGGVIISQEQTDGPTYQWNSLDLDLYQ